MPSPWVIRAGRPLPRYRLAKPGRTGPCWPGPPPRHADRPDLLARRPAQNRMP